MSEIQPVMRTRVAIVDSGPRVQPSAFPKAAHSGMNQRYWPGGHACSVMITMIIIIIAC